jgi:hypothetical protein
VNASASGKMSRVTKRVIILGADRMPISAIGLMVISGTRSARESAMRGRP